MSRREYVIPVKLDARTFRRFSRFDALLLRRKWVRPAAFALIFTAFAALALLSRRPQAGLIAAVLLTVGLGLPLTYFGTFFSQVRRQAALFRLDAPRAVYTVTLSAEGVRVVNDRKEEDPLGLPWAAVQAAFRVRGCIYLYASAARAFLLPEGQGNATQDQIWAALVKHMGGKCRDRR